MSTSLAPRPAPRARARTIVSALALLALGSLAAAQKKPGPGSKPASKPPSAPPARTEIRPTPEPETVRPRTTPADWERITGLLTTEHYARHPDAAFQNGWPGALELDLGAFGDGSGLRWRNVLSAARGELARLDITGAPAEARAQVNALADWVEAELLLLDAQALPMCDPASHVRQAARCLQAVAEAEWIPAERRRQEVAELLAELPAFLGEARLSLLSPSAPWVELALCDLDDLEQLAGRLSALLEAPAREVAARELPGRPGGRREKAKPPAPKPWVQALADFRGWLLALRSGALPRPPTLDLAEWSRLVELVLGRAWEPGEIKARCLRDLAQLELSQARKQTGRRSGAGKGAAGKPPARKGRPPRRLPESPLELRAEVAALRVLGVAREAQVLPKLGPRTRVEFASEESACAGLEVVSLRPGGSGVLNAMLQLPNRSWTAGRTAAREDEFDTAHLLALGARYGLTGEGLLRRAREMDESRLADLPVNRAQAAALGLFAQDWITRVDWVENPLSKNARLGRELARQRCLEAARLLAALEIHAEGISVAEAAASFQRRTGVHADVALAEALGAERDPLHGIGYLGLLELQALEQRVAASTTPRTGLGNVLLSVFRHPALRARDLDLEPDDTAAR